MTKNRKYIAQLGADDSRMIGISIANGKILASIPAFHIVSTELTREYTDRADTGEILSCIISQCNKMIEELKAAKVDLDVHRIGLSQVEKELSNE
jgi:hypothetical protein